MTTAETCAWKPEHDHVRDVPIGPVCGAPATYIIYWLDGTKRYSPACDEHVDDVVAEAPPHRVEEIDLRPLCAACSHQHDEGEPCLCPECGQPAVAPGAMCGRAACNA